MKVRSAFIFYFRQTLVTTGYTIIFAARNPELSRGEVLLSIARRGWTFPEEVRQGSPGGERLKGIIINTG